MPSGSLARPCPGHRVCSHWLRRPVTCSAKSLPDLGTSYPCPRAAWMKSAGAEIWGATEVPDPSLEAGVLPAAPPKARLWDQKPAKCRNRVGNAAGCYARAEASQGKHRTFVMPVSWTGGPQKVCLFNKKYKKREKKEKNPKKTNHKTKPKNHQESASRSCHPVAGPRVFCAGEAQPQQGPGVPRSPAGAQEPPPAPPGRLLSLTELWFLATGQASSQSPARGAAEEGLQAHGSSWQALQPLQLGHLVLSLLAFPCLCPGLPTLSLCLPAHIPYQRPVCTLWHLSCLPLALSSPNLICFSLSVDQAMEME